METTISNAFLLLAIGMITVFFILSLVVILGNLLIRFLNKFFPAETPNAKKNSNRIDQPIEKAIHEIVKKVTQGKGQVSGIEKIN